MKKVNEGYCAELFLEENGSLLKLYKHGWNRETVGTEYESTKAAHCLGIPSPQVYGMTEQSGRYGFWMERIEGRTMLQAIQKEPFRALFYAEQMAELHYKMHQITCKQIPTQPKVYALRIRNTSLEERTKERLLFELQRFPMPECQRVCHGDFHPMNILLREESPVVIDWAFASVGDPRADVAGTYMITKLLSTASAARHVWERWLYNLFTPLFAERYLRAYLRLSGFTRQEILRWVPIRAATYLDLGLPEKANRKLRRIAAKHSNKAWYNRCDGT